MTSPGGVGDIPQNGPRTVTTPEAHVPDDPQSPITELAADAARRHEVFRTWVDAARRHEVFRAWVDAGFTEDQALKLLIAVITATPGGAA